MDGNIANVESNTTATTNVGTEVVNPSNANANEGEKEKGKTVDGSEVATSQAKRRKMTSEVWNDFKRTVNGDKSVTATCKHCGRIFNGASSLGTSHLNTHRKTCTRRTHKDVSQQLLSLSKSSTDSTHTTHSKLTNFKFDPDRTRKDFAKMIAKHTLPFNMAEYDYFQEFVKNINPMVKFYSRTTVRKDVMDVFQEEKGKLYARLDKLTSRVSLTTDLWTSEHQNLGYCVITCHFIDECWNLNKRIISYKMLPTPHTGEMIGEHIKAQLLNWNLDKKICSVVVDNASSNDAMINHLRNWICRKDCLVKNGELFHVRCSAHILNLIVQDGLEEIRDSLAKIRNMVESINSSPSRYEKWGNALSQCRLAHKKNVSLDVPTRWNSTYEMLHNAIEVKDAFERLSELEPNFKTLPSKDEWNKCQKIEQCLEVFYDATKHMSGSKYPTSNFYFKDVCDVQHNLFQWEQSEDDCIHSMAFTMRMKFEKYWRETNLFMTLGVVLDPRYKIEVIIFATKMIYGSPECEFYIRKIRNDVAEIFSEYASNYSGLCSEDGTAPERISDKGKDSHEVSSKKSKSLFSGKFDEFIQERSGGVMKDQKSELDAYLAEELFPNTADDYGFDILNWWKHNGPKFPILSMMVRDILAVPTSTVASESAFSVGGRLITEYRSLLLPDVVEALICLRDWLPSLKSGDTMDA